MSKSVERAYECDICEKSFFTQSELENHYNTKTHEKGLFISEIDSLSDVPESEYYVYCIRVSPIDFETEYYYVGLTNNYKRRFWQHKDTESEAHNSLKTFPSDDKNNCVKTKYELTGFERIEGCESKERARIRERELMLEIARDKDTVDVIGGK